MPHIEPVAMGDMPPALLDAIERGLSSRMLGSSAPVQVWAHRPHAALAWLGTLEQFHGHGLLAARLRELVRLRIAAITACKACQLARKSDDVTEDDVACLASDNPRFSPAEQAALRYAELFAGDYMAIDEAVFNKLKQCFTIPEIVELNMFCALMLAGGRMTFVQNSIP
jgi:alkylhydroperoxidase family enzyme